MSINKIIGYILLLGGLVLIMWTLFQSYNIFWGKQTPPLVFTTKTTTQGGAGSTVSQQINQAVQEQFNQMISPDTITKILNLAVWFMAASVFILTGSTLCSLGIKLVKTI